MDTNDYALYINLRHRTDRRDNTERQFRDHLPQLGRFEAVRDLPGELGCSQSLVAVLEQALKSEWKLFLLLEDDMVWNDDNAPQRLQSHVREVVRQGADGAVLTTFHGPFYRASPTDSQILDRVLYATDFGATLFTRSGAEEMLKVQKDALCSFQRSIRRMGLGSRCSNETLELTTDRAREKVFKSQLWLVPHTEKEMAIRQPGGYSDLGHKMMNLDAYRDRHRLQREETA